MHFVELKHPIYNLLLLIKSLKTLSKWVIIQTRQLYQVISSWILRKLLSSQEGQRIGRSGKQDRNAPSMDQDTREF